MPSYQRKNARFAKFWPVHEVVDQRGNRVVEANFDVEPYVRKAHEMFEQSSRAEVPGQQQIDVRRLITDHDMPGVGLWSIVEFEGDLWDIIAPPRYFHGTRHTRHVSIMIRRRPVNDDSIVDGR